jgi:hypothetical protein
MPSCEARVGRSRGRSVDSRSGEHYEYGTVQVLDTSCRNGRSFASEFMEDWRRGTGDGGLGPVPLFLHDPTGYQVMST